MNTAKNYEVRAARAEDIPFINSLLEQNFHPEETILRCLLTKYQPLITPEVINQITEDQRTIIAAMISNYPCLVVVYRPSNKIVGVNVTIISDNPSLVPMHKRAVDVYEACPPKCQLLQDYFRYMNEMIEQADLFSKYPEAKRLMEFYAVAVDREHRSRGLSTLLLKEGVNLAWKSGIDLAFGLFTSIFSKRAATSAGMESVMELDLLEYRDADGSLLFADSAGHNIASVMVMETQEEQ